MRSDTRRHATNPRNSSPLRAVDRSDIFRSQVKRHRMPSRFHCERCPGQERFQHRAHRLSETARSIPDMLSQQRANEEVENDDHFPGPATTFSAISAPSACLAADRLPVFLLIGALPIRRFLPCGPIWSQPCGSTQRGARARAAAFQSTRRDRHACATPPKHRGLYHSRPSC
jgi:hypothetical protein